MRLAPPPNQPPTPNPTPTVWHHELPSAQVVKQGAYLHARRICAHVQGVGLQNPRLAIH